MILMQYCAQREGLEEIIYKLVSYRDFEKNNDVIPL